MGEPYHDHDHVGDFEDLLPELKTQVYHYDVEMDHNDYYDNIERQQEVHRNFGLAIVVILLLAFVVWAFTWYRNRQRQAYRYAFLLVIIGASISYQSAHFWPDFLYWLELPNQVVVFSLTAYAILTAIRAVRQTVNAGQTLLAVVVCTVTPLFLALLRWRLRNSDDWLTLDLCLSMIPNILVLVVGLGLTILLLYWVFALDNTRYKEHRDYRVIRYSSVCLVLVLVYSFALEISTVVFMYSPHLLNMSTMLSLGISYEARAIVLSFLLCFLDLEVWASCPCGCVDLGDEEDEEAGSKPLADAGEAPANEESGGKTHVSSFETEITPRLTLQSKPAYGTIQE